MKPVYIINGFLESGKTEFIQYTMTQSYFAVKGKTLLILCEEGEAEYEEAFLRKCNTIMEIIDEEEMFTPANLIELEKKHTPERIIVEYNGMWNFKNVKLPWHWSLQQQITMIDASTFSLYFTNMKSQLGEMIRKSEMIVFNRCDGVKELSSYKRNIKAINPKAEIIFEDSQGELNELMEEELPYNLEDDPIVLKNPGYGTWYLDILDHPERYEGKKVQFVGRVMKPESFPSGYFVPGRMAMTCCADDMAFLGFACQYDKAGELEQKQWVMVIAEVRQEYFEDYHQEGPVLHAISVEKTKAPKEEIISFN